MSRAQLNGVEIDYEVSGSGEPVLLSHGYSATRRMWDGQHRAFPDYQVISWSMRGHGQTESPPDPARYSAALTVGDMKALLRHVKASRAVVGGLSLGGYVSLAFYLAHPEMVRALVICDSGPGYRNAEARAGWNKGMLAQEGSSVIDGLAGIKVPTLIIVGDHDQPFIAPCEYMAKKIPGARLEVIAGAGHSSNLDQPEAFNRVLRDFLDGLP